MSGYEQSAAFGVKRLFSVCYSEHRKPCYVNHREEIMKNWLKTAQLVKRKSRREDGVVLAYEVEEGKRSKTCMLVNYEAKCVLSK